MEATIMKLREKATAPGATCKHCGGIIRYYRGSVSCLLCGRDKGHECSSCSGSYTGLKKTA